MLLRTSVSAALVIAALTAPAVADAEFPLTRTSPQPAEIGAGDWKNAATPEGMSSDPVVAANNQLVRSDPKELGGVRGDSPQTPRRPIRTPARWSARPGRRDLPGAPT